MKKIYLLIVISFTVNTFSQDYKFGKVSKAELEEQFYPLDSTADAAYLYKYKKVSYLYDGDQGWKLITEIHERIKIYKKEGFDYGTKQENIYLSGGKDERVIGIKATTYALVDGKVKKEKLNRKSVFREKSSKNRMNVKFTMPNLSEGCIVEWKYKIESPYETSIDDVVLQHNIPIKKLDVLVKIPEYYTFKTNIKGFLYVDVQQKLFNKTISFSNRSAVAVGRARTERSSGSVDLKVKDYTIKKENIPALKVELYVNNINNYRSTLEFELIKYHYPGQREHPFATTWERVSKTIFESSSFGSELKKQGHYKEELSALLTNSTSDTEKIIAIYQFVKSKIKWNSYIGKYTYLGVKKSYKEHTGNTADINLNLVSMLRFAGLEADPVLVSTRNNGVSFFPTLDGFNYVIAAVSLPQGMVLLDATEQYGVPNQLPLRAINWQGRLVKKDGTSIPINLYSQEKASEDNFVSIKVTDDLEVEGLLRKKYTNLNALNFRNRYNSVKEEDIIEKIEEENAIETTSFKILNKLKLNKPITITTKFSSEDLVEEVNGKVYITPLLFLAEDENPFKIEDRKYPVDFGTSWKEKNNISIAIPEGYVVESIPASKAISLSSNLGTLKYQVKQVGSKIKVISIVEFNNAIIPANYLWRVKRILQAISG